MGRLLATVITSSVGTPTGAHAGHATHMSTGAIALAVLGAVVVLACVAWAVARALSFEPHWTLSLRHSLAEAGFHASATWAELGDWLRLGR